MRRLVSPTRCAICIRLILTFRLLQYPHWTGRRDRNGSPICIFDIAALDSSTMNTYKASRGDSLDAVINGIGKPSAAATNALVFHDFLSRFILPLCSAMSGQGQPSGHGLACLYLVDISSLSLRQSWTLKEYTLDISKILANCYPEMIDRVFVSAERNYSLNPACSRRAGHRCAQVLRSDLEVAQGMD